MTVPEGFAAVQVRTVEGLEVLELAGRRLRDREVLAIHGVVTGAGAPDRGRGLWALFDAPAHLFHLVVADPSWNGRPWTLPPSSGVLGTVHQVLERGWKFRRVEPGSEPLTTEAAGRWP